jgi:hypothetical protein
MGRAFEIIGVYARVVRRNLSDAPSFSALARRTRQYLPGGLMLIVAEIFRSAACHGRRRITGAANLRTG